MKLIQLNAWNGRIVKPLLKFLEKERADILCLQEVIDTPGKAGLFANLDDIQSVSGLEHRFFSPVFSFNFMNRTASYGNCILSRYEITENHTLFTHAEFQESYDILEHGNNNRNLQHAVLRVDGKRLNVVNHHAYVVHGDKRGNAVTLEQMKLVGGYIDKLSGLLVLTGDFNLTPESESLAEINRRLTNLSQKAKLATTSSPLSDRPEVRDYIFVNDQIAVRKFSASEKIVSDHKALIVEFDL